MTLTARYKAILDWFAANAAAADSELHFSNGYELLVSVILSAQCTDKRVNLVTPALFAKWPDVKSLSHASAEEIYEYIKSVSYPNNKARNLAAMARKVMSDFGGRIPSDVDSLMSLPGAGRKTANVVSSILYKEPVIAVDTHVFRVANRIGLACAKDVLNTEKQLMAILDEKDWSRSHHYLIYLGRSFCSSRSPNCKECPINALCEKNFKVK